MLYEHICKRCNKSYHSPKKKSTYCSCACQHARDPSKWTSRPGPECGKIFEYKKSWPRNYCSVECKAVGLSKRRYGKYRTGEYKPCKYCGEPMWITPSMSSIKKYCSRKCRQLDGWIKPDPSKKAIYVCEWCKKEFEDWTYRKCRFCSDQCRSEFAARQPKPNAIKQEIHITKTCRYCGKEYETTTHQERLRGSNFCSRECNWAQMSIDRRGENNPRWNGGTLDISAYGSNWGRQKRRAKKRDNHQCQNCGYKIGGKRMLDVHHIIPLKEFDGDWKRANRLKNLISLCRNCHAKIESGKIPCPPHGSFGSGPREQGSSVGSKVQLQR